MRVPKAINIRRYFGGDQLPVLDRMAYSGCFDCDMLDSIAATVVSGPLSNKGLAYYTASLYLQLGEKDRASDLLKKAGRASRQMKWFSILMLHCLDSGLRCPKLSISDVQCLEYLRDKYSGFRFTSENLSETTMSTELTDLINSKIGFAVLGNAPLIAKNTDVRFSLPADCVTICFNNYHLNPRIDVEADIHVVTPSWQSAEPAPATHLVITGNSIFYRRSKVWRRFEGRPSYTGIHTVPRPLWSLLVRQLDASPSAGLLLLSCLENCFDLSGKVGLIAGFSDEALQQNHSYDREPISPAHNWTAEVQLRKAILARIGDKSHSLQVTP